MHFIAGRHSFGLLNQCQARMRLPADELERVSRALERPVLIGEWHFGALDASLPASGIGCVADQVARGQAYQVYFEHAAVQPWCVGVHYFVLYDQSALGRFDGENYNIGFLDVCNQPYAPLAEEARSSHARLYPLANGDLLPYDQAPQYLPRLYLVKKERQRFNWPVPVPFVSSRAVYNEPTCKFPVGQDRLTWSLASLSNTRQHQLFRRENGPQNE